MEACGICGLASSLKCGNCGKQSYCDKGHQREHWPQHRLICKAVPAKPKVLIEEEENETVGRFLVAAADISEETLLFRDTAIVVGPTSGSPALCLGCLQGEPSSSCPRCSVPLCSPRCQHMRAECDLFRKSPSPFDATRHSDCILPLRCLLNVRDPNPKDRWKDEFLRLEAHLDVRRHLPVWHERNVRVVDVLKSHGFASADGSEDELLQRICGILDVNSFEVRSPDGGIVRAVFPRAALMAHSCVANVHVAVDDNRIMSVRAAKRINKGEALYYCYTSVLQGTAARQEHLWEGKYFRCKCSRCEDPSELGTHVGSIWCPRCVTGLVTSGQFDQSATSDVVTKAKLQRQNALKKFPFEAEKWRPGKRSTKSSKMESKSTNQDLLKSRWQCCDCKHLYSAAMIRTVERVSVDMVDSAAVDDGSSSSSSAMAERLQKVLNKLQCSLSPQHAVMLHGKQLLGGAYRDHISQSLTPQGKGIKMKAVAQSVEICRELATVLDKLEGGAINRNVGIALHGLYEPLLLTMANRSPKGNELVNGLRDVEQVLEGALRHLRVEPPESPEGRLAVAAFTQLADVQERLQATQQAMADTSRRNNRKKKKK